MLLIGKSITLMHLLVLSGIIFSMGVLGVLVNRSNIIAILVSLQIIFIAIYLSLVSFSVGLQDFIGQTFAIFISVVMMMEVIIGTSILIIFYKNKQGPKCK